jgi:tetratricopeptide (TPR) repeat protein
VQDDPQSLYEFGLRLYELGDLEACEQLLRVALLEFPDDGRIVQLQGLVWHARRRYLAAVRALELASALVPLSLPAQLAMADSYRRAGRPNDARPILSYLAERSDMPTVLLPNLTAGLGLVGEYQQALDVCREASRREPERDEPLYGMAYYMNKLGYPTEVMLALLRRCRALAPESRLYRTSLAVMCGRAGLWEEAYELFADVDPQTVRCQTCIRFMIGVFEHIGDHERRDAGLCRLLELVDAQQRLLEPAASGLRGPSAGGTSHTGSSFEAQAENIAPAKPE